MNSAQTSANVDLSLWLVVYGVGGCLSSYNGAAFVVARDKEAAESAARVIADRETREERGYHEDRGHRRGYAFDVERVSDSYQDTSLWSSRLDLGGKAILQTQLESGMAFSDDGETLLSAAEYFSDGDRTRSNRPRGN